MAGNGFTFLAPDKWKVTRSERLIIVAPSSNSPELLSVQVFRLRRPARWPRVIPEVNGVARLLTTRLKGSLRSSRTVAIAGRPARQYEISYSRFSKPLTQRITFVFSGRREYQLSCRWPSDSPDPTRRACQRLAFTLE